MRSAVELAAILSLASALSGSKTRDYFCGVSWQSLLDRVDAFPKNQRFVVGQRLADRAIENCEMEAPRAMQTFPESGLRAAAASGRDGVPDHIRSDNAALRTVAAGRHLEKAGRVVLLRRSQSPRLGMAVGGIDK